MVEYFKVHGPYAPVGPFEWPKEGVRTWEPPERSVFPGCTDRDDCRCACSVGVRTVGTGVYGCDCKGHDAQRGQLAAIPEPRPAVPWWDQFRHTGRT